MHDQLAYESLALRYYYIFMETEYESVIVNIQTFFILNYIITRISKVFKYLCKYTTDYGWLFLSCFAKLMNFYTKYGLFCGVQILLRNYWVL